MMKKLLTVLIAAATMVGAMAEVPSLINYQGRLKEKNGTNVNGSKNFTVRIFDAKTGGKQIYEENVGAVTINEGAYSFGFGEAGKSVVTPTEILARTDGEKQVFNYITKHKPILGNVTISGAGLSWTDVDGSSDTSKFTSTLNKNSGAASAIFLTQAPDSGTEVSISYDHNSDGVMNALSRGGQSWLEIAVSGETLSPRERLVTVPFALFAGKAKALEPASYGEKLLLNYGGISSKDYNNTVLLNKRSSVLVDIPKDKNKLFTLYQCKLYVPENAKYLKLGFAHFINAYKEGAGKRNVKANYRLLLNDEIIKSIPLKNTWSQPVRTDPSKIIYTEYSNVIAPTFDQSGFLTFKIQYEYISGGGPAGGAGRPMADIDLGGIMYLIILAAFD